MVNMGKTYNNIQQLHWNWLVFVNASTGVVGGSRSRSYLDVMHLIHRDCHLGHSCSGHHGSALMYMHGGSHRRPDSPAAEREAGTAAAETDQK